MDPQPTAFLIAMAGVAVVALVGFLALLLAKSVDARHAAAPRWAAFALALALLVVAAVALVWQLAPLSGDGAEAITVTADAEADAEVAPEPEAEPEDWRQSGRANAFFTVMPDIIDIRNEYQPKAKVERNDQPSESSGVCGSEEVLT